MSLRDHIAELRRRIIVMVLAIAVGGVLAFVLYPTVLHWGTGPYRELCEARSNLRCTGQTTLIDPLEGFGTRLKVATYLGIVIALPVLLWQIWRFVAPGLHHHEKRYAVPFVLSSLVLFALGGYVAFWTFPQALAFLIGYSGDVQVAFTTDRYVSLLVLLIVAFGVAFLFPVVLVALQLVGVLTPQQLAGWRRYAWVLIFVVAAVGTPSGDPYSLFGMAIPMCLFYEGSIVIGRVVAWRKGRSTPEVGGGPGRAELS